MLLDPISKIQEENSYLPIEQLSTLINNIENIRTKLGEVYALSLPIVVKHTGLEAKNRINSSRGIYTIDWANSFKSFGFVDFAQFKNSFDNIISLISTNHTKTIFLN